MDILFIEKLTVKAVIGIHGWERKCFQKLVFDLQLAYNYKIFKYSQNVSPYLDYTQISQTIFNLVNENKFYLIEDVAEVTAKILMERFCINWLRLQVSKPSALDNANNVGVCIIRKRD